MARLLGSKAMRKTGAVALFIFAISAGTTSAQPNPNYSFLDRNGNYLFRNFSVSGGVNNLNVDFSGVGGASNNTGIVCVESDFWDVALRYAGEFAGFRVAAAAGYCHGFGDVREPVGGFTGHAELNSLFTLSLRAYTPPVTLNRTQAQVFILQPYLTGGFAYGHFKVAAVPFESFSGFLPGFFVGFGVETRSTPFVANGARTIDQAAISLYAEYRHYEFSEDRLSGGLPFDLDMDTIMAGARVRY
jgi:hypothetical protein